mgnify:CR=1 FL=1
MMQISQAVPSLWQVAGDIIAGNLDIPGAKDLAERLKKTLPPGLAKPSDEDAEAQGGAGAPDPQQMAAMQQAQAQERQAQMESQKMVVEQAKVEVERAKVEVDKLKVEADMTKITNDEQDMDARIRAVVIDVLQEAYK